MITSTVKITKDDYERLKQSSVEEVSEYICKAAIKKGYPPAGYGLWGEKFYADGDGYYVTWKHLSSCD